MTSSATNWATPLIVVTSNDKLYDEFYASIQQADAASRKQDSAWSSWDLLFGCTTLARRQTVVDPQEPNLRIHRITSLDEIALLLNGKMTTSLEEGAIVLVDCTLKAFEPALAQVRKYSQAPRKNFFLTALVSTNAERKLMRTAFKKEKLPKWLDVMQSSNMPAFKLLQCMMLKQSLAASGFLF